MAYKVMARYYAKKDDFGESYVLTSDNENMDTKHEIGTTVYVDNVSTMGLDKGLFGWMRSWLTAYAKAHDMTEKDVSDIMEWIDQQPMTSG